MFQDKVTLLVSSGKGGNGCISFRKEKFVVKGGPNGGDGGKGGDIYFIVDHNTHILSYFRGKKQLKAENGRPGESSNKTGRNGADLIIKVPPGTVVKDESGLILLDMANLSEAVLFLKGGKGGFGNTRFKSATNRSPRRANEGQPALSQVITLEMKLIADVGLVGFPNVGKSTLIASISHAKPEIANYEFTTLSPKLGFVSLDYTRNFVMADIPGIIEGASDGKGLGLAFLRHIERTSFLLLILDLNHYKDLCTQYRILISELQKYSQILANKPFAIAFSKLDICTETVDAQIKDFFKNMNYNQFIRLDNIKSPAYKLSDSIQSSNQLPRFMIAISAVTKDNIEPLLCYLYESIH